MHKSNFCGMHTCARELVAIPTNASVIEPTCSVYVTENVNQMTAYDLQQPVSHEVFDK